MRSDEVYRHADREMAKAVRTIQAAFNNQQLRATWDELNVISVTTQVNRLYGELDVYLRGRYLQIAKKAYRDAWDEVVLDREPDHEPDEVFVGRMMDRYDPKTEYQYSREWERKRDRLKEAMLAVGLASDAVRLANTQKAREVLKRALKLLERQVREMADTTTDEARTKAFEDAGIELVQWNTQRDGKVCRTCQERDGQVYGIDDLPPKHPHCRCWYSPVRR